MADVMRHAHRWLRWCTIHALLAAGLWQVLTGGRGWAFGAVVVLSAATAPLLFSLPAPRRWSPRGAAVVVAHFLLGSGKGAVDVSRRAIDPRIPVQPGWMRYEVRLPSGRPTTLFVAAMNLLPGTIGVALWGRELHVHTLGRDVGGELEALEARIARLFRLPLEPTQE